MTIQRTLIVTSALVCVTWGSNGLTAQDRPPTTISLSAEDRDLDASFEEVYRLGSLAGDRWDAFGRVATVGFDGTGNLYILDTGAVRVHVVDLQGNLLRQFLAEGEGPGEVASGDGGLELATMRDGRVAVYDPNRLGFALFDATGDFERTIPLAGPHTHFAIIRGLQAFPRADRFLTTNEVGYLSRGEDVPDDETPAPFRYVLSYDLSGDQVVVDSVVVAWKPPGEPGAFEPRLEAGVLPNGALVYTDSSTYAIKFAIPGGPVTRILTRPFRPRPVTDRMKAAEIERRLEGLGDGGGDPFREAMIEWERNHIEEMEFYHEVPVVVGLSTSWEGTIWVRHRGEGGTEGSRIDLISSDGRHLGTFPPGTTAMPAAFGPNGLVAFVDTDEMDVQYVVVKRLPEGLR